MYYILENKEPVKVQNVVEWAQRFDNKDKVVEQTQIGEVNVSTVFLGMDHGYGVGTPVLFETMIFGGEHDQYQERYCTWEEAEKGHHEACKLVLA